MDSEETLSTGGSVTASQVLRFESLIEYQEESIVSRAIIKKASGNVTLFAFAEGQELSEHTAPFDALVQILDGSAEISIDGQNFLMQSGQSILMPAHKPHAVRAAVRFKMLLTMIKQ